MPAIDHKFQISKCLSGSPPILSVEFWAPCIHSTSSIIVNVGLVCRVLQFEIPGLPVDDVRELRENAIAHDVGAGQPNLLEGELVATNNLTN